MQYISKSSNKFYEIKSNFKFNLKDIDDKKGIAVVYPSIFGNIDSDGDMIMIGAFKKSISERGSESMRPRIKHLYQHNMKEPIGIPIEMKEDNIGLRVVSKFGTDSNSQDKLKMHIDGLLTELSIGFQTIKSDKQTESGKEYNRITEIKLWEYSSVTFGANSLTRVIDAKGEFNKNELLFQVNEKMLKLTKALKNGTYTDETFYELEIELKQIQQLYNDLIIQGKNESDYTTDQLEGNQSAEKLERERKEFYKNLII